MSTNLDIESRWPELFASLTTADRRAVMQTLANGWHEGWPPNREDVENLTDLVRGAIDEAEYDRRVDEAARRHLTVSLS